MKVDQTFVLEPKAQAALEELAGIIAEHYPGAQFRVSRHPEEAGMLLLDAVVDVDGTEQVLDLICDRLEQIRLDEGVPILVFPLRTPERVTRLLEGMQATRRATAPAALS